MNRTEPEAPPGKPPPRALAGLLWVLKKELALFVADRHGAMLTVVMPVLLGALVGLLFAPRGPLKLELLVADEDRTAQSAALVAALASDSGMVVTEVGADEARRRIATGKAATALILPPGTGAAVSLDGLFKGRRATATLLRDPSKQAEAGFAHGLIQRVLFTRMGQALADPAALGPALRDLQGRLPADDHPLKAFVGTSLTLVDEHPATVAAVGGGAGLQLPLTIQEETVAGAGGPSDYNSYAHTFAGMLCTFLLFGALGQAKNLVEERDRGTLTRMRLASLSPGLILLGTGLGAAVVALVASVVVYAVAILGFGVEIRGSLPGFAAVLVAQAAFVGGFTLLFAGLGRTARQVDTLGTATTLVMSFVGGAWLPSFLLPGWLDGVSRALPLRWATDGLAAATWRGLEAAPTFLAAAVLLAYAALFAAVGIRLFRWEQT